MTEERPTERIRLLIVDDEVLNRELLRRVLKREYDIEEAEDAAQAVKVLEECGDRIHVILCDQLMPGRTGTELAVEVRERWPDIKFLLLTGFDEDPAVKTAFDDGLVGDVLAKPWRGSVLKSRIMTVLGQPGA